MLGFLVALLGAFPIVAPVWTLPSLLLLAGLTIAPPLLALLVASGWPRPRFVTRAVLVATALSMAWAYRAPAYTPDRPLRMALVAVGDGDGPRTSTVLAVAGNEPALDLGSAAPLLTPAASVPEMLARFTGGARFVSLGMTPEAEPAGRSTCAESPAASGEVGLAVTIVPAVEGLQSGWNCPGACAPAKQLARACPRQPLVGHVRGSSRRGHHIPACARGRRRWPGLRRPAAAAPGSDRSTRHRAGCRPGSTGRASRGISGWWTSRRYGKLRSHYVK